MKEQQPEGRGVTMIDREPLKPGLNVGRASPKERFCATTRLVPAPAALLSALERRMVDLQEPASGESRLNGGRREIRPMANH